MGGAGAILRSRAFLVLALAATMTGFAAYAVVITLVPLLTERGLSTTTAAVVLGLGGAGQVLGRLGYPALAGRTSVRTRTVLIVAATAATIALLGLLTTPAALVLAAALAGTTRGLFTLLQATAVTDRWGTVHYGQLSAVLSAPVALAAALAPWAGAALAAHLGGYPPTVLALAALTALAAVIAAASIPRTETTHHD